MATIAERKRWREEFLRELYDAVEGRPGVRSIDKAGVAAIGASLGIPDDERENVTRWLSDNGLAEWVTFGTYGITPEGVNAVESMDDSSVDAVIVATPAEVQIVERFLTELRRVEDELQLEKEHRAVLEAEQATLEAQIRSPRPNKGVMRSAMRGMRWALGKAAGGALGAAVGAAIQHLG